MKGNEKLLTKLNELLADELTAISQYMVHSKMCENWGYEKLHNAIEKQAHEEMYHAEWLIQRTLFLDGMPVVSKLNRMQIGNSVSVMSATTKKPSWQPCAPTMRPSTLRARWKIRRQRSC